MNKKNLALRGTVYSTHGGSYGKLHLDVVQLDDEGEITCADYNSALAKLEMEGQFNLEGERFPYACRLKNKEYYPVTNDNYKEFHKAYRRWNTAFDYTYDRIHFKEGNSAQSYVRLYVETFANAFNITKFFMPGNKIISKEEFIEVMDDTIHNI